MSLKQKGSIVAKHIRKVVRSRKFRIALLITGSTLVILNIGLGLYYNNRAYPRSSLAGKTIGGQNYQQLQNTNYLPGSIELRTDYKQKQVSLQSLGTNIDWGATTRGIEQQKSWLPLVSLLSKHQLSLAITYDESALDKVVSSAEANFKQEPVNWTTKDNSGTATIEPGKNGNTVDTKALKERIAQSITSTGQSVSVPLKVVEPTATEAKIKPLVDQLLTKQKLAVKFVFNGQTKQASSSEIYSWYTLNETELSLSREKMSAYITAIGTALGIRVQNLGEATQATTNALDKQVALSFTLIAAPKASKQYTFCVQARGVNASELPGFTAKFLSTLNNTRGWALDGQVSFSQADSGCSFAAWLAAANQMSSFGAICDSAWSCAVSPNVIINYDRWQGASDAWNASGGGLDDYRSMVINHETGHWLGFGHSNCGGAGQPAPVMQQQSINLQGCAFNPWPTAAEKSSLKARLRL